MSLLRSATFLAITVLLAGTVHATEVSMADGSVNFSTPDNWLGIMETQGDPEARVFQVPDPSPTGKNSLARVTVTVKRVDDVNGFHQYRGEATAKAMALPGYKAAAVPPAARTATSTPRRKTPPASATPSTTGSRTAMRSSCAACAPARPGRRRMEGRVRQGLRRGRRAAEVYIDARCRPA